MYMAASRCLLSHIAWPSSKGPYKLSALLTRAPRRKFREIFDDTCSTSNKKISTEEVNSRIYESEFYCFPDDHGVGFTANQLDVNRPVEDRWSAFRLGGTMRFENQEGFYDSSHPLAPYADDFPGGHLFTVVDGHAGHTCAHAVNMLHADYITSSLLPQQLLKPIFTALSKPSLMNAPPQACELAQPYLLDPSAFMTSDAATLSSGSAGSSESASFPPSNGRHSNWRLWGQWGPLDAEVNRKRLFNIHRFLKERMETINQDSPPDCVLQANGSVYDAEGFQVCCGSEFESHQLTTISSTATSLRTALTRMDSDITSDAVPHPETGLNKSLLRIVLSGCVATSVYLPHDLSSLYVLQIGDCGAVLGRFIGTDSRCPSLINGSPEGSDSKTMENRLKSVVPGDWEANLLVAPHNAQNLREVERLQSQHPIHEASLMIVEDRLLCELIPLRAFGDIRYKMPSKVLKNIAKLCGLPPSYPVTPRFYTSPPYLFATPQIACHRLDHHRDRFIVLASDGLWDMLTPHQAVCVVAQHYLDYHGNPSLAGHRDTAASRLIRTALGGREMDTARIAMHLSVPANVARFYRDDITVQVIYLNP